MSDPKVIDRLRQIEQKAGGVLRADDVLKDAKKPTSPLHDYFDWDDDVAAQKWRVEQARRLIRSVRVVIQSDTVRLSSIAYVQDPDSAKGDQGYTSTASLRSEPDRAMRALMAEAARADAAMRRAHEVAYSLGLSDKVDAVLSALSDLKEAA